MEEYPFELWVLRVVSAGGTDASGFETNPVSEWVKHSACYEQVTGQSFIYRGENGDAFSYSSKIFLPEGTEKVEEGTDIQVRQNGSVRFAGTSKRFSRDIEHCRLWA